MARKIIGSEIERLIQLFSKVPGLGPRSARRATLHLIKKRETLMSPLANAMQKAIEAIIVCDECGNLDTISPCNICQDQRRDKTILIVVEDIADIWALERAQAVNACYHVLGGTLSALDGIRPEDLNLPKLHERINKGDIQEVILALNATIEGQTTAHFITDILQEANVKITRLAHGVPVGGELDYLDDGTLATAMRARTPF